MNGNIVLPKKLFKEMISIHQKWNDFSNELEDYLFSKDKKFIEKMKNARKHHKEGNIKGIKELK